MSSIPLRVRWGALAFGVVIVFCLVKVLPLLAASSGELVRIGVCLLVVLGVGGFATWRGTRTSTSHRTHVHGADWADAARHEAGHVAMYRAIGAQGIKGKIRKDGTGYVEAQVSSYTHEVELVAVCRAGGLREGVNPDTSRHCTADMAGQARVLRGVRRSRHSRVIAQATSMARGHIHSGYAASVERKLLRSGRL